MVVFMSANNSNRFSQITIYFVILIFTFIVIFKGLSLQNIADDVYFSEALKNNNLLSFLMLRYNAWSGRTLIEAIMVSTINFHLFWKLAIPASLLIMCHYVWKLTLSKHTSMYIGTITVVFFMLLMSGSVAKDGEWWVTGFYNYLLPVSLGFFSFSTVIHKGRSSTLVRSFAVIAAIVCCQQEQAAIALIGGLSIVAVYRKSQGQPIGFELIILILSIISACFLFFAPGNYHRLQVESRWLPEFPYMGLEEKLMLGLDRLNSHVHDAGNRIILLATVLTAIVTFNTNRAWSLKPLALVILGIFAFNVLLNQEHLGHFSDKLGFAGFISPNNWYHYKVFFSYTLTILLYLVLACCALYISNNFKDILKSLGPLSLSVILVMAVSLSPTVYASGARILYLPDVLLIIYSCFLLAKLLDQLRNPDTALTSPN